MKKVFLMKKDLIKIVNKTCFPTTESFFKFRNFMGVPHVMPNRTTNPPTEFLYNVLVVNKYKHNNISRIEAVNNIKEVGIKIFQREKTSQR